MPTLQDLTEVEPRAESRLGIIDRLIACCDDLAAMDFELLYDRSRHLLSIGYDLGERRRDPSWYDLLASEARLTSYLLVAQGQVPQKHWFALGRLLTSHGGDLSLMSWSGSMFEYLMPRLFLPGYENTLLEQACQAAVSRQIEYGRQRHVPWGISESCYNAVDMNQVYQYRGFGVPGLGFKTGLADDLVIAPYATALALTVVPREACRNLQTLGSSGFLGDYGLYEAIDYTPSRVLPGTNHAVVRSLHGPPPGDEPAGHGAHVARQAHAAPIRLRPSGAHGRVAASGAHPQADAHRASASAASRRELGRAPAAEAGAVHRVLPDPNTPSPEVHLLSNGSYHVMATNAGGGYSRWRDLAVTRWREDATCDDYGTFIYLRDRRTGRYWSATYQPTRQEARPPRGGLRPGAGGIPQARSRHRGAHRGQRLARGRRRDPPRHAHQPLRRHPGDRGDELRGGGHGAAERGPRPPHVQQPLRADRDRARTTGPSSAGGVPARPTRTRRGCSTCWRSRARPTRKSRTRPTAPGSSAGGGRRRIRRPSTKRPAPDLSNTQGSVLDPIVAIRGTLRLSPDESRAVQVISGVAETREAAIALLGKYRDRHFVERAFEMAWFESQEVLRLLNMTETDAQIYGRLAGSVIYAGAARRASPSVIARNTLGQAGLWRFGISGDLPIVLVRIGDVNRIDVVRYALQAHGYWRNKGLAADLVILNEDFSGYRAVLQDQIMGLINAGPEALVVDRSGGVFVRRAEELSEEDRVLFQTVARVVLTGSIETMAEQVQRRAAAERLPSPLEPSRTPAAEKVAALAGTRKHFPQRPGRLHRGRAGVRHHPRTRSEHAGALGERHRQPAHRDRGQREGRRIHLGGERPRIPPDHLPQRPGGRQQRRGLLPARRRDGRLLVAHAAAVPRTVRLRVPARLRL